MRTYWNTDEDDREIVLWSSYVIREQRRARFTRNNDQCEVETGWRCPRCDTANTPTIEHGEIAVCQSCGLYAQVWGNGMHLSASDPTAKTEEAHP